MIEDFATRIKELRIQKGLSQLEVAEKLDVSRQAISQWENGKGYPDVDKLVEVSDLYGVSVDELLGKESVLFEEKKEKVNESNIGTQQAIIEMMGLCTIVMILSQIPIIGVIGCIVGVVWMRRYKRSYKIVYLICFVCMFVSLYNTFIFLNYNILDIGQGTIEKIE